MTPLWIVLGVLAVAGVGVGLFLYMRRVPQPVAFTDDREERLASAVARSVGCAPADALAAVRQELGLAPNQSDEVLTKRAAYHYTQAVPERRCSTYRDASPG